MDVPRDTCSSSRVNPRRVKRPVIRKVCHKVSTQHIYISMYLHIYAWCHKVEDNSTATTTAAAPTSPASQCEECREGENSAVCDVEHFPYTTCRYCRAGACVPGACHKPARACNEPSLRLKFHNHRKGPY